MTTFNDATEQLAPGAIEVSDSGSGVRVRFALPQEWFTLPELRAFAAYLVLLADENEPSAELDDLARILETASLIAPGHRPTARAILAAGYKREPGAEPCADTARTVRAEPSLVGLRLRRERERIGWTLREAENRTGVPNAHISQIETGAIQRPELATLAPLAAAYGISLDELASSTSETGDETP